MSTNEKAMLSSNDTPSQSVEEFLAAGGHITEVPPGVSGENPKGFNWNHSHYKIRKLADLKHGKDTQRP